MLFALFRQLNYRIKRTMTKFLYIVTLLHMCASEYTVRVTNYGKVRGIVETAHGHKRVEKFFGIPFASPPVGPLRFEVRRFLFYHILFIQHHDQVPF